MWSTFKSWFWALMEAGGSWWGFCILIFIWIWSLVFDTPILQRLSLYLHFEGAKNICSFKFWYGALEDAGCSWWGFWGKCGFLTGVWHLDLDLDIVTVLWYTHALNFGSLSWFWRYKVHPCLLSPDFGLWKMLEDPDWGSASWSWFL